MTTVTTPEQPYDVLTELIVGAQATRERIAQHAGARVARDPEAVL